MKKATRPPRESIESKGANRLHYLQRHLPVEIAHAEAALKALRPARSRAGMLLWVIGFACCIFLPVIVLLNSAQDAPVLEMLLGITGDPWDSPFGPVKPLAVAVSIAVVIAMGLAAMLALGTESHIHGTDSSDDAGSGKAPVNGSRPRVDKRQIVRLAIAVTVMLLFVVVLGWGSYIRGKLLSEDGNPLAAQNAIVSCAFSVGLALIEEIAIVGAMVGFLVPLYSVVSTSIRLGWLRRRWHKVQGRGVVHNSVVNACPVADALLTDVADTRSQVDATTAKLAAVSPSPTPLELGAMLTGFKERRDILALESASLASWLAAPEQDPNSIEQYGYRNSTITSTAIDLHKKLFATANDMSKAVKQRNDHVKQKLDNGRARTAFQGGANLTQITEAGSRLPAFEKQIEEYAIQRIAILTSILTALDSNQFREIYSEVSQIATLKDLNDLLVKVDGYGVPHEESDPVGVRITKALTDLSTRKASAPPAGSPLGVLSSAVGKLRHGSTEAFDRLMLTSDPQIAKEMIAVEQAEVQITASLSRLERRVNDAIGEMAADARNLAERLKAEQRANRPFIRVVRMLRNILPERKKPVVDTLPDAPAAPAYQPARHHGPTEPTRPAASDQVGPGGIDSVLPLDPPVTNAIVAANGFQSGQEKDHNGNAAKATRSARADTDHALRGKVVLPPDPRAGQPSILEMYERQGEGWDVGALSHDPTHLEAEHVFCD